MVTSHRTKWFALALLCAVQFMVILDVSIVNVVRGRDLRAEEPVFSEPALEEAA